MSVHLSVHLYVRLSLKILVSTELIQFYSSGNIPTGPGLRLFSWGVGHPHPQKNKKKSPNPFFQGGCSTYFFNKSALPQPVAVPILKKINSI